MHLTAARRRTRASHVLLCGRLSCACVVVLVSWYYQPGMPPVLTTFDQSLMNSAQALADKLLSPSGPPQGVTADALAGWDSAQVVLLLERLLAAQKEAQGAGEEQAQAFGQRLRAIDELLRFSHSKNCEIRFRWLTVRDDAAAGAHSEQHTHCSCISLLTDYACLLLLVCLQCTGVRARCSCASARTLRTACRPWARC